jgi:hypothetical protein
MSRLDKSVDAYNRRMQKIADKQNKVGEKAKKAAKKYRKTGNFKWSK